MEFQDIFSKENHTYKITKDIDLKGETLNVPNNCILDFQGGTIKGGTLNLNNTLIRPTGCVMTDFANCNVIGSYRIGQCLYDKSKGKPIWWNGEKWITWPEQTSEPTA